MLFTGLGDKRFFGWRIGQVEFTKLDLPTTLAKALANQFALQSWNLQIEKSVDSFRISHQFGQLSIFCRSLASNPRSGELRTQKLKSHPVRTQSLIVFPLKPGVGQYIAMHATFTARDFFLAYFYPSSPFTCIYSKTSLDFFLCWLWLTPLPV